MWWLLLRLFMNCFKMVGVKFYKFDDFDKFVKFDLIYA
jgi:hypothetical protein